MSLPAQPNQSLIDGITVLQELAARGGAVGGRELARELGLDATRVNRLLKTLAHLGLLEQTPNRKYQPGPGMHVLAAQSLFGSGLIRRALPHLQMLHRHGHIVALGVLWRDHVSYLYHAQPEMTAGEALGRVGLFPASRSGIGMALLAQRSVAAVRDLYRGRPIPGHDGLSALLAQLRDIRRVGYALIPMPDATVQSQPASCDGMEASPAAATLAVAIGRGAAATAAVALSGHLDRSDLSTLIESLTTAAEAIGGPLKAASVLSG